MMKLEFDENNSVVVRNMAEALTNIANEMAINASTEGTEFKGDHQPPEPNVVTAEATVKPTDTVKKETPTGTGVDSEGLPWDGRIHSTAKSKNNDGTWKTLRRPKKFGDDDVLWKSYVEEVREELKKATSTKKPEPETSVPTPEEAFGDTSVPTPEEAFADTQEQTPESESTVTNFPELMIYITTNSGNISMPEVTEICNKYGVNELIEISATPDLIPSIYTDIKAKIDENS